MPNLSVSHRGLRILALGLALALGGVTAAVPAQPSPDQAARKLDRALRGRLAQAQGATSERVIVRVRPGTASRALARLETRGGIRRYQPSINAFVVDTTDVAELARLGEVESVSIDAEIRADAAAPADTTGGAVLRRTVASVPRSGKGVGVAVIDSGLEPSADFRGRITAFYDFTRGGVPGVPYDDYGHGTHVAGLIGGAGVPGGGHGAGLAPDVRFVVLKVLDGDGVGYASDVIDAIEFATANRAALGVDVINLSLGHPPFESPETDPLVQAVEAAVRAGIVVVASAGNDGTNPETGEVGYAGSGTRRSSGARP